MAKPVRDWNKVDLEALIGADETSDLEFKSSAALAATGKDREKNIGELAKDASAMANANGGLIVYGINERSSEHNAKHKIADSLDSGTDTPIEWVRQILSSNIEPKIDGLEVWRIPFENGRAGYVIEIPAATTFAPHQSKVDKRYYRRLTTTIEAMLDHEVRDLMRRGTTPALEMAFDFRPMMDDHLLVADVVNGTDAPSLYTSVTLALERNMLSGGGSGGTNATLHAMSREVPVRLYRWNLITPGDMPIFRGVPYSVFRDSVLIPPNSYFSFSYSISCPGYHRAQMGDFVRSGVGRIRVERVTEKFEVS